MRIVYVVLGAAAAFLVVAAIARRLVPNLSMRALGAIAVLVAGGGVAVGFLTQPATGLIRDVTPSDAPFLQSTLAGVHAPPGFVPTAKPCALGSPPEGQQGPTLCFARQQSIPLSNRVMARLVAGMVAASRHLRLFPGNPGAHCITVLPRGRHAGLLWPPTCQWFADVDTVVLSLDATSVIRLNSVLQPTGSTAPLGAELGGSHFEVDVVGIRQASFATVARAERAAFAHVPGG